jgi:hypothetical protein
VSHVAGRCRSRSPPSCISRPCHAPRAASCSQLWQLLSSAKRTPNLAGVRPPANNKFRVVPSDIEAPPLQSMFVRFLQHTGHIRIHVSHITHRNDRISRVISDEKTYTPSYTTALSVPLENTLSRTHDESRLQELIVASDPRAIAALDTHCTTKVSTAPGDCDTGGAFVSTVFKWPTPAPRDNI